MAWLIFTSNVFLHNTGKEGCDEFWRSPAFGQLFGDIAESSQRFVRFLKYADFFKKKKKAKTQFRKNYFILKVEIQIEIGQPSVLGVAFIMELKKALT